LVHLESLLAVLQREGPLGAAALQARLGISQPVLLSFFLDEARPFALAPAYDMLPMGYQPATNGEIVARRFAPDLPLPEQRDAWQAASTLAIECRQRIEGDVRVSTAFREIARDNARLVDELARRA
jgi:hypothetical protein